MIPKETLERIRKTIKRIEIATRKVVDESLAGQYHSVFKGKGMEFSSVREYVPGDQIRSIDWNVTARMGKPFTKQYSEERELTVLLAVDASASMSFGSGNEFKNEAAALVSALIAFSAIKNNDRVGLIEYTDNVELHIPARKGRQHVLRILRDVLFFEPRMRGSNLKNVLDYINRTHKKRSVIFVISDFLDTGYQRSMQILEQKHDVVAIQVRDKREHLLESAGLIRMKDAETGDISVVDTSSKRWREKFNRMLVADQERLEHFFKSNGIDHLLIETDEPYDVALVTFFKKRAAGLR